MSCMPGAAKTNCRIFKVLPLVALICYIGLTVAKGQSTTIAGKSILALQKEKSAAPAGFFVEKMTIQAADKYPSLLTVFQANRTVPTIYSFEELAFFCKVEVELEKAAGLPVKFRLGSVPYVDRLEGKTDY